MVPNERERENEKKEEKENKSLWVILFVHHLIHMCVGVTYLSTQMDISDLLWRRDFGNFWQI